MTAEDRDHMSSGDALHPRSASAKRARVAQSFARARRCDSVAEVQSVVRAAREARPTQLVRCGGNLSASALAAFDPSTNVPITLQGALRAVSVRGRHADGTTSFHVGGGAMIGDDPTNPEAQIGGSLMRQIDAEGCALPLVGGSSIMTIAGYVSTGSEGGSTQRSLAESIEAIEIVDGLGEVRTLVKGTDDFDAAGVSLGLFGVVTGVTLRLPPRYRLRGTEQNVRFEDSILASAEAFLDAHERHENVHAYWFPNEGVHVVQQHLADQVAATQPHAAYVHEVSGFIKNHGYTAIMQAVNVATHLGHHGLAAALLRLFASPRRTAKPFCDDWHVAVPSDDQVAIATRRGFDSTEIWFDAAHAGLVLATAHRLFASDPIACGNSGLQIFCAKRSPFWMSPAYEGNQIRVDVLWWPGNPKGTAGDFFRRFWDAFLGLPSARLHWGKDLPPVGPLFGPGPLAAAYPRLNDWLAIRERFDPHQIFVSDFWREIFGIPKVR
jgi:D-arabinono-1,4-lactone oxidase